MKRRAGYFLRVNFKDKSLGVITRTYTVKRWVPAQLRLAQIERESVCRQQVRTAAVVATRDRD